MGKNKKKISKIIIIALSVLLFFSMSLNITMAFFTDFQSGSNSDAVKFGKIDLEFKKLEWSEDVNYSAIFPGDEITVTGQLDSFSTTDYYIFVDSTVSIQRKTGENLETIQGDNPYTPEIETSYEEIVPRWENIGNMYIATGSNSYGWTPTSENAIELTDITLNGIYNYGANGTLEEGSDDYITDLVNSGWTKIPVAMEYQGTEINKLYEVDVSSAGKLAHNGVNPTPENAGSYKHTVNMQAKIKFKNEIGNQVYCGDYSEGVETLTPLVINQYIEEKDLYRVQVHLEYRAVQKQYFFAVDGVMFDGIGDVFTQDQLWAVPNYPYTENINFRDVYYYLSNAEFFHSINVN